MTVEIKAPAFPESVADGVVSAWHKGPGDSVARDELLVEIETDKVVMEVVAPEPGVIGAIIVAEGETITSEAVLATLTAGAAVTQAPATEASTSVDAGSEAVGGTAESIPMGPAVRALLDEHGLSPENIVATVQQIRINEQYLQVVRRQVILQRLQTLGSTSRLRTTTVVGHHCNRLNIRKIVKLARTTAVIH